MTDQNPGRRMRRPARGLRASEQSARADRGPEQSLPEDDQHAPARPGEPVPARESGEPDPSASASGSRPASASGGAPVRSNWSAIIAGTGTAATSVSGRFGHGRPAEPQQSTGPGADESAAARDEPPAERAAPVRRPRGRRAGPPRPEDSDVWGPLWAAPRDPDVTQALPPVQDPPAASAEPAASLAARGSSPVFPRSADVPQAAASSSAASEPDASPAAAPGRPRVRPGGSATPAERRTAAPPAEAATTRAAALVGPAAHSSAAEPADGSEESPRPGGLRRTALWTVLTSLIPGTGLLTTRRRGWGISLLAIGLLVIGGAALWWFTGSPLMTLLKYLTNRRVLIGLLVAVAVVGVVWILQILATQRAHRRREGLRGGKRAAAFTLALAMAALVAVPFSFAGQYIWAAQGLLGNSAVFQQSPSSGRLATGKDPWAGVGRINVLLLGQDAGADRTGTRPDTIMVASIDTKTGRTALFSVPRNLENPRFPEGTAAAERFPDGFDYYGPEQNLINAVWSWAGDEPELFPEGSDPGLTATTWAVEEALGLPIDYYAMVNLDGFSQLVDAIGGVDMTVERRIPIGGGTNQATGGKYPITGWIEPGPQHLNGYQALWYARSREGSSDFNRLCRQQRMVQIVTEEADPATLALNFTRLVGVAGSNIETDVPADDVDAFVDLGTRVKSAGFASYPIQPGVDLPERVREGRFEDGHPDWDFLKQWVQDSIADSMTAVEPPAAAPSATPEPTTEAPTTEAPPSEEAPAAETPAAPAAPTHPLAECLPEGATDVRG